MFYRIKDNLVVNLDLVKTMLYQENKEILELKFIDNSVHFYRDIDKENYEIFLSTINTQSIEQYKKKREMDNKKNEEYQKHLDKVNDMLNENKIKLETKLDQLMKG